MLSRSHAGEVVIRIVFDGPAEAGKTSTIDALARMISLQRRGPIARPGTTERRTEYFDWLDFSGGFLAGQRVHCQLLSVPGQPELLHRRRYLLDSADVVVFVADATAPDFSDMRLDLATTLELVRRSTDPVPPALLLQVNKQDAPGAIAPQLVARQLALDALVPVVGTSALTGMGVMQTLILAVRLATDRARSQLLSDDLSVTSEADIGPEALYRQLLEREPAVVTAVASPQVSLTPQVDPGRPNPLYGRDCPSLPQALLTPAGCVWPAVAGRAALAVANQHTPSVAATLSDFASDEAWEVLAGEDWIYHSEPDWLREREGDARRLLLTCARHLSENPVPCSDARALVLTQDVDGWRMWVVSHRAELASLIASPARATAQLLGSLLRDSTAGEPPERKHT